MTQSEPRPGGSGPGINATKAQRADAPRATSEPRPGGSGPDRGAAKASPADDPGATAEPTARRAQPLAYFLTFTTYGSWLHGDENGSIDRHQHGFRDDFVASGAKRVEYERFRMKGAPVTLDTRARSIVEDTIQQVAANRGWEMHALNVRTNHIHAVVTASVPPVQVLTAFKAWSTRRLTGAGVVERAASIWTRHGSTKYLWDGDDLAAAVHYVLHRQGAPLPRAWPRPRQMPDRSLPVAAQMDAGGVQRVPSEVEL